MPLERRYPEAPKCLRMDYSRVDGGGGRGLSMVLDGATPKLVYSLRSGGISGGKYQSDLISVSIK